MSDSLQPLGLQHTRLLSPSSTPRGYSNSCLSSRWCHPTISSSIIPFNLSQHQALFKLVLRIRWPMYWSFSFSISPFNKYLGLISFRIEWLGFLEVQGTLKSFLQHHSSKHQFFSGQLSLYSNSHVHMTTGKTIALTRRTFVGKEMCLLFNTLSRLVIAFFQGESIF